MSGIRQTIASWTEQTGTHLAHVYNESRGWRANGITRTLNNYIREFLHYFQNPKAEALIINRKGNEIARIFVSLLLILNLISTAASAQSTHMYKGSHEASVEMTEIVDRLFILPKRIFWVVYLTCQILRHEKTLWCIRISKYNNL